MILVKKNTRGERGAFGPGTPHAIPAVQNSGLFYRAGILELFKNFSF
jgi:hypothetical protein